MRRLFVLLAVAVFALSLAGVAMAAPAKSIVLAVAPNIPNWTSGVLGTMTYKAKMTTWTPDVYDTYCWNAPFEAEGFAPECGYKAGMDYALAAPDPRTALMELLTGMKYSSDETEYDVTIFKRLRDERGWRTVLTDNFTDALAELKTAWVKDDGNPLGPGIFILVLYQGSNSVTFATEVKKIVDAVNVKPTLTRIGVVPTNDADWYNTLLLLTQGWAVDARPVPLVGMGFSAALIPSVWNGSGIPDNTEVYEGLCKATLLDSWPRLWPRDEPRWGLGDIYRWLETFDGF